jgi:hypothetical protein
MIYTFCTVDNFFSERENISLMSQVVSESLYESQ